MRQHVRRAPATAALAATAALLLLLLAAAPAPAAASSGDESPAFRACLSSCMQTGCAPTAAALSTAAGSRPGSSDTQQTERCSSLCRGHSVPQAPAPVPPALLAWRWDCRADCSYLCMWQLEESRLAGQPVQKYHGKWPFLRWAGMQEPASVMFSVLNLAVHALCLLRYLRLWGRLRKQQHSLHTGAAVPAPANSHGEGVLHQPPSASCAATATTAAVAAAAAAYPYAWAVIVQSLLSANAWLWSAVFHGRDTRTTERVDYFSADISIFFNLFLTVIRTAGIRSPAVWTALGGGIGLFLARHIHHMLFVLFDYGLNVKICVAVGVAQSLMWVAWTCAPAQRSHPGRHALLAFVGLLNACMLLEILDFPPIAQVLDAHALWHLATVPVTFLWYRFAEADLQHTAVAAEASALKAQ